MHKLEDIRDKIIVRAFPEFLPEDIRVGYKPVDDGLFQTGGLTFEGYYIEVDPSVRNAPRSVVEGGLAHELSHLLVEKELTLVARVRGHLLYWSSRRYRTLDERNTDFQVILRGYGPQLLALLEYCEEKEFSHYKDHGLSTREVRILLSLSRTA